MGSEDFLCTVSFLLGPGPCGVSLLISILRLDLVLIHRGFLPSFAAVSIYLFKPAIRHGISPELIGSSRNCVPMAFSAESPLAQGQ